MKNKLLNRSAQALLIICLISTFFLIFNKSTTQVQAQEDCLEEYDCNENDDIEDYLECLEEQKSCLEDRISETQEQAQTLQSAINVINGEISLQRIQVSQTLTGIKELEKEISELGERIDGLSLSLDSLTDMLIERIQASYKQQRTSPLLAIFFADSFKHFIAQYHYLHQAEIQTAEAMELAENQRLLYDQQKDIKEIKQNQLEEKRQTLQAQQATLEAKKQNKQKILNETKNDEATYQKLLAEAQKQISALKSYATSQVGDATCMAEVPDQPDGWYWSQRDPRWCKQTIGNSRELIGEVGCLISSTAMIWSKHGHDTTPSRIAANADYFSLNTAYMKNPLPAPPGYKYSRYDYRDLNLIDKELAKDRPVIVHLSIGGDGHFIVLKKGSDGDYKMNDPLFAADMDFSEKYSISMIDSIRTFTPN